MPENERQKALEALPEAIRRILRTPRLTVGQIRKLIGQELMKVTADQPTEVVHAPKRRGKSVYVMRKGHESD